MIKNTKRLKAFEKHLHLQRKLSYAKALQIVTDLHEEALALKVFSPQNLNHELDHIFRLAKFLNTNTAA